MRAADGPRAAPFGFTRIVFLSHVITAGGPTFPGDPPVEIHPAATIERDGYHLQSLVAGEQAGTHWARIRGGSGSPATVFGLIP